MKIPFTLLLCFFSAIFYAEVNKNSTSLKATTVFSTKPFERKAFIENRKQFNDNLPAQYQDFQFCIDNNSQILFTKHGLTHVVKKYDHKKLGALSVFMSEEKREAREHEFDIKTQYISLEWLNANPNAEIEVGEVQAGSYNYVMRPQGEKPYTEVCKGYSKLTYKNLYEGIDVEYFFTEKDGFKYNLIVHAGADIGQVKMLYSGDVKLVEKDGNIIIKTLNGDIIDHAPVSYLADNLSEHVTSSFNLKDNIVSFTVNNPNKQAIIIDPWTLTPTGANPAYDNGVDGLSNIYLYGGVQGNYIAEKYTSAGTLIWSLSNGTTNGYYGDMLVESGGNFYLSDGFNAAGANTYKYSSTSAPIWVSTVDPNFREHWRISLNCVTNQVIVVGGGTTVPTDNIAQIDINTGALTNVLSFGGAHDDMSGLCVDVTGKSYVHGGISNTIVFTNTSNSAIGTVGSGYNQSEIGISTPSYYPNNSANGYNMMALGGATFLFTTDGATLKKWDRNTFALLGSVAIPGGSQNLASGILADNCNNVFVGSTNGVYRFDFNLVQKEYQATTAAVFDIAYSPNSDIIACGAGFFADLAFGRETCGSLQTVLTVNPCNPNINTVTVHPILSNTSNPPYSFLWDDGNTDSTRTNLSPGKHIVTVKDASCIPQFTKDTIVIAAAAPLTIVKNTPCFNAATGSLQVNISEGQQITSYSIAPAVASSLTNDSTIKATALAAGTYTFHVVSSSGCAFDSAITLNQLTVISATTQSLTAAICPGNHTGSGQVTANGSSPYIAAGSAPYIYSWNTVPVQTTSVVTGVKEGTYVVTITDSVGCSVKDSVIIFANSNPHAAFANTTVCQGVATAYTDQSVPVAPSVSPISTWSWDFNHDGIIDNTTQNPNFTFPASGTYTTSLVISDGNGCKDSVLMPVNVYPNPTINFSSTAACFGMATTFANTSTIAAPDNIASWSWTFGEGTSSSVSQNPSYTYTTAINSTQNTTYNVQLLATSNFGCKDSLTKPVMVYALPTASFTADSVCLYNASHLTDASNGNGNPLTTYNWDVTGDNISDLSGTPTSYTFNSSANNVVNYTVTTTPVAGLTCTNFTTQNVYVNPLPQPAFTFTNACVNMQPTNFDASASSISVGTNSLYSWSFGDTQTGLGVNTTHTYNNAQNYTVLLTVTSNKGCTDTVSHTITTYPKPTINFSYLPACFDMATTFANTSTIAAPDNIASWGWTFGEGVSSSVVQNPSYTYITASNATQNTTYNVQLLATSNNGCKDSLTKPVVVYSLPTASFTADSVCLNNTSHLTDASNGNGNPLTTYNWDVTNDNVSDLSGTPTSYNFALVGNNVVNYTVTTTPVVGLTCTNFTTQNVYVYPLPQPAFTFTNACVNMQPTNFDASASSISVGTNNIYSWSFGDTQTGLGVNTTHTYNNAQNYTVLLTVTSNKGCTDTISHTITTYPKPTINFSYLPACFGMATTFANTSTIAAPDNIASWSWTFGEGVSSSVVQNPSYTYTTASNVSQNTTYNVQLLATSNHGCKDSASKPITVYSLPTALFKSDSVCFHNQSHLTDVSNGNGNTLSAYNWDVTNDNVSDLSGATVAYTFTTSLNNLVNYTVSTTPVAGLTCTNFTTQNVYVNPLPQPAFTFANTCINTQPNTFNANASTISAGNNAQYLWSYGDTQTGTGVNSTHTYNNAQNYNVQLTVISAKGCSDTISHVIDIYPKPQATISVKWQTCFGSLTSYTANTLPGSGTIVNWQWDVNNSITSIESTGQTSNYQYGTAGSHTVALITTTDKNCFDTIYHSVYVNYLPQVNYTIISPTGCSPHCVDFSDNGSTVTLPAQIKDWGWSFGDGAILHQNNAITVGHCYTDKSHTVPLNYNIKLVVTTDSLCADSLIQNMGVTIYPNPLAGFGWDPKNADVLESTINFTDQSIGASGANAYNWNFGDTYESNDSLNHATIANPRHTYINQNPADYYVTQVVSNIYGCKDSVTEIIIIHDAVTFYIPNAFSPNGDGTNEGFKGTGIGINNDTYNLWVFDRWGLLLFYSTDLEKAWDGTRTGGTTVVQEDVYVWKVIFEDKLGKSHNYHGTVTVLK